MRLSAAFNAVGELMWLREFGSPRATFRFLPGHPVGKSSLFGGKDVVDAAGLKVMTSADEFKRILTVRGVVRESRGGPGGGSIGVAG